MMQEADKQTAYRQAFARLGKLTPLPMNCGLLCDARCCKGSEGEGMILFEGEEPMLKPRALSDMDMLGYTVRFLECTGWCRRETRPLSCRIYPLAPYIDKEGVLTIQPDPRAKYMCPLLKDDMVKAIDPRFYAAVEDVFRGLLAFEGFRPMLVKYSRMLDVYKRFLQKKED